ncbi:MAG: leucine-rich repeat domain-containing protein, partial [Clostridia bacterium]|nr:leucine-rich repeat domain-containing protein [Clostridia bacterium]
MRKKIWIVLLCAAVLSLPFACAMADTLMPPAGVTAIEAEAFMGDTALDEAELPEGLLSIGSKAFAQSSLKRIYLPESLSDIAADAFLGCQSLTAWGYPGTKGEAFCRENGIAYDALSTPAEQFTFSFPSATEATVTGWNGEGDTVIIPEMADETHRVTAIGASAFKNNTELAVVRFPKGLETVSSYAFQGCIALTDVVFNDGLKTIGGGAFNNCTSLLEADLPDTVEVLGNANHEHGVFQGCASLTSFHYPRNLKTVSPAYYSNGEKGTFYQCPNFKNVSFPEGLTAIAANIFSRAASLEEINIPNTVTEIGEYA